MGLEKKRAYGNLEIFGSALIFFLLSLAVDASPFDVGNWGKFVSDGNILSSSVPTDSGHQQIHANGGLLDHDSGNFDRVFGDSGGSSWYAHERRKEAYFHALRVTIQPGLLDGRLQMHEISKDLHRMGLGASSISAVAEILDAMPYNYVSGDTISGQLSNGLAHFFRGINPRSAGGVPIKDGNLGTLARYAQGFQFVSLGARVALAAAFEEALAADVAVGRLNLLRTVTADRYAQDVALREAFADAEAFFERNEAYFGALINQVMLHMPEIKELGFALIVELGRREAAGIMVKNLGIAKTVAAAKVGAVGVGVLVSYKLWRMTVDQRAAAQVAVAASTLRGKLENAAGTDVDLKRLRLQAEFAYFTTMEDVTSGFLQGVRNVLSRLFGRRPEYAEAKEHFASCAEARIEALRGLPDSAVEKVPMSDQPILSTARRDYRVTRRAYDSRDDWAAAVTREFGPDWRVAEWNEVKEDFGGKSSASRRLAEFLMENDTRSAFLLRDGSGIHVGPRFYFISAHFGNRPANYAAFDQLHRNMISLGSWHGSRPVLAARARERNLSSDNPIDEGTIGWDRLPSSLRHTFRHFGLFIGAAIQRYNLEHGKPSLWFVIHPDTGRVEGPLAGYIPRVVRGLHSNGRQNIDLSNPNQVFRLYHLSLTDPIVFDLEGGLLLRDER